MKGGKDQNGRRRSGPARGLSPLSEEDKRLWTMVMERLEPLRRAKHRVHAHDAVLLDNRAGQRSQSQPSGPGPSISTCSPPLAPRGATSASTRAPGSGSRPAAPPLPSPLDRRKTRQIARNQRPIDAVLDLHGMRQREAHAALRTFLLSAHGRGLKLVKVITGKGYHGDTAAAAPQRPWSDSVHDAGERGVLKRLVPEWLHEPELRRVVVAFSSAARGHGGEGALYVELRRKSRVR